MRTFAVLAFLTLSPLHATEVALVGATVYPSPERPPIEHATLLIRDGVIVSVGAGDAARVPPGADAIDCSGKFVVAGFWNSHVHILAPALLHAQDASVDALNAQLDAMFNRWGFTHVFDLASVRENTFALRRRIERGELRGPRILTTGDPLWTRPPIYIVDFLAEHRLNMPAVKTAEEAVARVDLLGEAGVDGIKLFTGSMQPQGAVAVMPLAMVQAASARAHSRRLPVFAHPQNQAGLDAAIDGGVDVLAHTTPQTSAWTPALVQRMRQARMALVPTLALFDSEGRKDGLPPAVIQSVIKLMVDELRTFSGGGGEVLFGTDIGYIDNYDTTLEFTLMARAGMTFPQILASLTTAPARRFAADRKVGKVEVGFAADLVVLDADPARSVTALARVHTTLRDGRVTYAADGRH